MIPFTALLWNKTQALVPHWIGMTSMVTLFGFLALLDGSLTLAAASDRITGGESAVLLVFLLAFSTGHATLGPEFFSRHIEFLDGLPVRRSTVFAAKLLAALLPSLATIAISLAWDLSSSWVSPGPLGASPFDEILAVHALLVVGALAGLGAGLLGSWIGALAWGVLFVAVVLGAVLALLVPPTRPYVVGFGSFGSLEIIARQWTHPVAPIVVWLTWAVGSTGLAGLLFVGPGGGLTQRGSLATGTVRIATVGCVAVLMASCGGLSLLGLAVRIPQLLLPIHVTTTEHFRILDDGSHPDRTREVAAEVEAMSTRIAGLLGTPRPVELDLEFLGAQQNHAGVFTGGKIRLGRSEGMDTVAHELAHAHAFQISGPSAWRQKDHTRFFDEGLASWVGHRVLDQPTVSKRAAAIHALDPVAFDLLVEDRQWVLERDIAQPYPVGEVFVEALVQVGGTPALTCVLEQIGAAGSERIAGLALWVGMADRCGLVLEDVIARFERLLEEKAEELPMLPDVEATLVGTDLLINDVNGTSYPLICRFRSGPDAEVGTYEHVSELNGRCALPLWQLPEQTFGYQVGFRFEDDAVFDRWVEAPTPR